MKPWQVAHANGPYRDTCSTTNWLFGLSLWEGVQHSSRGDSRRSFVLASWLTGRLPWRWRPCQGGECGSGGEPGLPLGPPRQATQPQSRQRLTRGQQGAERGAEPDQCGAGGEPEWPETERERGGSMAGSRGRKLGPSPSPPRTCRGIVIDFIDR